MISPGLKSPTVAKIPDAAVKLAMLLWSGSNHAAMVRVEVSVLRASNSCESRVQKPARDLKEVEKYISAKRVHNGRQVRAEHVRQKSHGNHTIDAVTSRNP